MVVNFVSTRYRCDARERQEEEMTGVAPLHSYHPLGGGVGPADDLGSYVDTECRNGVLDDDDEEELERGGAASCD